MVIITVYAITPDGKIVYALSPFLLYMLISTFISGPFMLPKIRHLTHHWFLSAKAKRNYFHFRERSINPLTYLIQSSSMLSRKILAKAKNCKISAATSSCCWS
ncbi:hypothetical protein [Lacticaseibacillus manihotivorans]|uniref:hypothetical protein n=1 Tax=Lacticaseibacillus manihotivorans TaxID=88233 RepID=UPI001FB2968B|nr:hypothetical protein [Lacticaseibacillus manihotivorans]